MKLLFRLLPIFVGLSSDFKEAEGSVELSALGAPKCDLPGRWRTGQKLNFTQSIDKGAIVANHGHSWMKKLEDCANWCCRLSTVECSVAMLEIKTSGANCHLVACYPPELCVFNYVPDFLSFERILFGPSVVNASFKKAGEEKFSFQEDARHKNVIKPRKGVQLLSPGTLKSSSATPGMAKTPATEAPVSKYDPVLPTSGKTSIEMIFLYSAIILAVLGLGVFFGQKFFDFWERRHYTRADFLLDGMYEHPSTSCS